MTIVFKLSNNLKPKVIKYYEDKQVLKKPPYSVFQAREADTVITLYESGKIMFQGISADIDANIWIDLERRFNNRDVLNENPKKDKKENKKDTITYYNINTIGSDEVGTGDYFGPIVVTASYVNKSHMGFLNELGVKDSKKLTDDQIKKIAPLLIKKIPYATFILDNKAYNEMQAKGYNMNKIKAILHNKALGNLLKENPNLDYDKIIVDQFVYEKKYYEHLAGAKEIVRNITFTTKGESKCLAVAASSVISRYIFLMKMHELSTKYNTILPLGASDEVDKVAKIFYDKDQLKTLNEIAKLNFKNTEKIQG
ncbi:MAG: ribonuclease HIII [Bacilli bacterium]|nr:ribonuclease HIII [Bacilli bacterium]